MPRWGNEAVDEPATSGAGTSHNEGAAVPDALGQLREKD
jgi:hypothetical protein